MNPLMNMIGGGQNMGNMGNIAQIKRMMNMLQTAQNPQAALQQLAQQNPVIGNLMQSGDLKGTFYRMCEEKGVNPDDILNQLK